MNQESYVSEAFWSDQFVANSTEIVYDWRIVGWPYFCAFRSDTFQELPKSYHSPSSSMCRTQLTLPGKWGEPGTAVLPPPHIQEAEFKATMGYKVRPRLQKWKCEGEVRDEVKKQPAGGEKCTNYFSSSSSVQSVKGTLTTPQDKDTLDKKVQRDRRHGSAVKSTFGSSRTWFPAPTVDNS